MTDRLRVLTMNVLAPRYADWPRRRRVIADELRALRPDVVALQEVVPGEAEELLGDGWHLAPHPRTDDDGAGAVLAARWPLGAVREAGRDIAAPTGGTPWYGTVAAEVRVPGPLGPLLVVHHKPVWPYGREYERERQAVAAARLVEQMLGDGLRGAEGRPRGAPGAGSAPGAASASGSAPASGAGDAQGAGVAPAAAPHVVLLGDLDAAPDAASIRFLTGLQSLEGTGVCYRDAWRSARPHEPGHTFTPRNALVRAGDMPLERGRRIDYVMVRCGPHGPTLDVAACDRVLVDPVAGVQASDHYGVVADLVVPARQPGAWD